MLFPEVQELCLEYTGQGTQGSGRGRGLAKTLVEAIREAIQGGLKSVRALRGGVDHFERRHCDRLKRGIQRPQLPGFQR